MLVLTCAMTMTPKEASADTLLESMLSLLDPARSERPGELMIRNETDRTIAIQIHAYYPQYDSWFRIHSNKHIFIDSGRLILGFNDRAYLRIKLKVWNKNTKKWVLKDTFYPPSIGPWYIDAWKVGRGEFRLIHMWTRP